MNYKAFGIEINFSTDKSSDGYQFCKGFGGIGGFLRYKMDLGDLMGGVDDPDKVALMGNFNVTNVSPHESWVTVGEMMPRKGYTGDVLLSRIRWSRPNALPLW